MSEKNRESLLAHMWWQAKDLQKLIGACLRPDAPENIDATPMLTRVAKIAGQAAALHTVARTLLATCASGTEESSGGVP